jgi:prepilin-type processing-associated H-X9-DG protein
VGASRFPPHKRWSWTLSIGNYTQHYGTPIIDLNCSWDDPTLRPLQLATWSNGPFRKYTTSLYAYWCLKCPNGTHATYFDGQAYTDYVGIGGIGTHGPTLSRTDAWAGVWAYETQTRFSDCGDGAANTLFIVETNARNGCWLAGGDPTLRGVNATDQDSPIVGSQFGGLHRGGAMAVYVDGHVVFLRDSISTQVFLDAVTICGNGSMPVASARQNN